MKLADLIQCTIPVSKKGRNKEMASCPHSEIVCALHRLPVKARPRQCTTSPGHAESRARAGACTRARSSTPETARGRLPSLPSSSICGFEICLLRFVSSQPSYYKVEIDSQPYQSIQPYILFWIICRVYGLVFVHSPLFSFCSIHTCYPRFAFDFILKY